jgi:HEAT repeat protein
MTAALNSPIRARWHVDRKGGPMTERTDTEGGVDLDAELEKLDHKKTRAGALEHLGEEGGVEAVLPLLHRCADLKKKWRRAVAEALAEIGEPAVPPLAAEGLTDSSKRVRRCAARALGLIGSAADEALEGLVAALDDPSQSVRLLATDALGEIGDPRAAAPLVALLDDKDDEVREAAVDALGEIGEPALEALRETYIASDSLRVRLAVIAAGVAIGGDRAVGYLREALADPSTSKELRVAMIDAVQDLTGADSLPLLEAALADESKHVRREAVRSLRDVDAPGATETLIALIDDPDDKVASLAVRSLRERYPELLRRVGEGELRVLPALLAAWRAMGKKWGDEADAIATFLVHMGEPLVKPLAVTLNLRDPADDVVEVLARMGPEAGAAYEDLVALLDHPDPDTCCAAARALGALGNEAAIPVLAERLAYDPEMSKSERKRAQALQHAAAEALGALGREALPAALDAARSGDATARVGGLLALGHIGGGRALSMLDRAVEEEDEEVRDAAAEALELAASTDVRRLYHMLQSEDEDVRAKAVKALGKLDDLRSLDLLLRAYGDPSDKVNRIVVEALAAREGERATSILIAAAAGGNTTAIHALEAHPNRQAIPALAEALDAPWYEVYTAALETLRHYGQVFAGDEEAMAALRVLLPEIRYLLHDDSAKTRRLALETIGALGDATLVPAVAELVLDDKEAVQFGAVRALADLGGEEASEALRDRLAQVKDEDLAEEIEDLWEEITDDEL